MGLFEETIEPDKDEAALVLTSLKLYVCPWFKITEKVALAAWPIIAVRGVIKTIVLFCVATTSIEECETGVVVPFAQNSWKGV